MLTITSSHNPRLKDAARLVASAHERRKSRRCSLEGEHLIEMYVARYGQPNTLIVTEAFAETPLVKALVQQLDEHSLLCVSDALFKNIASLPPAVGMLAVIDQPSVTTSAIAAPDAFCVLLEDVQDPCNVGALLRTAAAAGVTHAVLSKHCASVWSPKVLRAAQGAHFLLEIAEDADAYEWGRAFRANGGTIIGTLAAHGQNVFTAPSLQHRPLALVFGNEGVGLSDALTQLVDTSVTIPMPGHMESLNVASAAAIVLFECVRQAGIRGQGSGIRKASHAKTQRKNPSFCAERSGVAESIEP
ncbi:MAG: RNA methyltransferase [Burkholderiales bacterium]|jgi:TrmH family RNA methyltransferase|nr:RNA methyltransferase [Burkholderiales bacterium]